MLSHPSEEEIGRFLSSRLDPAGQQRVVRHLLAGCGICSRKLVEHAPEPWLDRAAEGRRRKAAQDSPRDRTLVAALRQEARWRTGERKLAHSLERLGQSLRSDENLTPRQVRVLHGPPLVEDLLRRSFEARHRDPRAMLWLAFNAVNATESVGAPGPAFDLDLRARAWGGLANAYRINDQLAEAEAALGRARALLRQGDPNPRLLAHLGLQEALLRTSQRRLVEAQELFGRVHRLYLRLGEEHLAGQTLISRGIALNYQGSFPASIKVLRKALLLLDPQRDPEFGLMGTQSLIDGLIRSQAYRKAGELLLKSGLRQAFERDPIVLLKIRWTEAQLLGGIGSSRSAAGILAGVRNDFLDLGQEYDAALVGLDSLPFWLATGSSQALRQTAKAAYEVLHALGIPQEAAKAQPYLA